jgi:hypothetical protein
LLKETLKNKNNIFCKEKEIKTRKERKQRFFKKKVKNI